jgi:outer membrane receptor for ferrienterochelin and colicins
MWDVVVAVAGEAIQQALGVDLSQIPPPTPGDVRTELRRLNTTDRVFEPASASGVTDIQRLEPTISHIVEVGYKGLLGQRLLVGVDVYYERRHNFIGPLIVETPNLFYNTDDLRTYLIGQGLSAAQAGAVAANVGGVPFSPTSGVPLGTVQPDHEFVGPNTLMLTYRNFGEVDLWGTDLHVQAIVTDEVTVSGAYSYVSRDFFTADELGGLAPVALNAPQHKGSAGVSYRSDRRGLTAELQGRFVGGFPMNSGAYIGEVESYQVLDAGFGIRMPQVPGASLNVRAQNLLDHRHRQWVGAPELGRLVMVRLQYEF